MSTSRKHRGKRMPDGERERQPVPVEIKATSTDIPVPVKEVPLTIKEIAIKWLLSQGAITVLLFLILGTLVYGVPKWLVPVIQAGYERISDNAKTIIELQEKSHERDREAFREAVRELMRHP